MLNRACRAARKIALIPRGAVSLLLIQVSRRSRVADFELADATDDHSSGAEDQLLRSFNLIRETLPRVYARLRRDVRRVILLKAGGPEYLPFTRTIAFKKSAVDRAEIPLLAMTLVHEATHARLWNNGIGYPANAPARIEHLCVRAEVRLARELPDADELEKFAVDKLKNEWWTESAVTARRERTRKELTD
jgi:hypothetical protein